MKPQKAKICQVKQELAGMLPRFARRVVFSSSAAASPTPHLPAFRREDSEPSFERRAIEGNLGFMGLRAFRAYVGLGFLWAQGLDLNLRLIGSRCQG